MEEEDEPVSRSPTEREAGGVQWQRRAVWLTPTPTPTLPLPVLVRCLVGILRLRRWLIWPGRNLAEEATAKAGRERK
jgi:hypothetical protein